MRSTPLLLQEIAFLIKELRLKNNLSQENLAEKSQLDRTYISGVERLQRNLTIKTLSEIINALEIKEYEFFSLLSDKLKKEGDL